MRQVYATNCVRIWVFLSALVCFQTLTVFSQSGTDGHSGFVQYQFVIKNENQTAQNGYVTVTTHMDFGGGNTQDTSSAQISFAVMACGVTNVNVTIPQWNEDYANQNGWPVGNFLCHMNLIPGGNTAELYSEIATAFTTGVLQANTFYMGPWNYLGSGQSVNSLPVMKQAIAITVQNSSSSPQIAFCIVPPSPFGTGPTGGPFVENAMLQPGASVTFTNNLENSPCNPASTNLFEYGIVGMQNAFSAAAGGDNGQGGNLDTPDNTIPFPNQTNYSISQPQPPGQNNIIQSFSMGYTNPSVQFASPATYLLTNGQISWNTMGGTNASSVAVDEAGFNSLAQKLDTLAADLSRSNGLLVSINGTVSGATNIYNSSGASNVWVQNWPAAYSNGIAGNGAGTNYYGFTNIFNGQTNALTLADLTNYISSQTQATSNSIPNIVGQITAGTNVASQLSMEGIISGLGFPKEASSLHDDSGGPSVSPTIVVGGSGGHINYIFGAVSGMPNFPAVRAMLKWAVIISLFCLVWRSFMANIRRMFFVTANAVDLGLFDSVGAGVAATVMVSGLIMGVIVSFCALILPTLTGYVNEVTAQGGTNPMATLAATWAWQFLCQYAPIPYILSAVLCWIGYEVFSDGAALVCLGIIKALSQG